MIGTRAALVSAAVFWAAAVQAVERPRPPAGASSCTGCHAAGAAMGGLDGRSEAEIAGALAAYRAGERPASIMTRIARGFDATESRAIAAYFAGKAAR